MQVMRKRGWKMFTVSVTEKGWILVLQCLGIVGIKGNVADVGRSEPSRRRSFQDRVGHSVAELGRKERCTAAACVTASSKVEGSFQGSASQVLKILHRFNDEVLDQTSVA